MDQAKLKGILHLILDKLTDKEILWRLDGSANLLAQGVDTDVNDLDIVTNDEGMKVFQEALKDFIVQEYHSEEVHAQTLEAEIDEEPVEIHFYDDEKYQMLEKVKKVKFESLELPCLPLVDAKKFYELIKREDKVKLIEEHMKK
tara:strand:- start:286 stop:717 length:432 start_codon:yes stop_codon:yes gene_type:complete